jgi:hypothetical protein
MFQGTLLHLVLKSNCQYPLHSGTIRPSLAGNLPIPLNTRAVTTNYEPSFLQSKTNQLKFDITFVCSRFKDTCTIFRRGKWFVQRGCKVPLHLPTSTFDTKNQELMTCGLSILLYSLFSTLRMVIQQVSARMPLITRVGSVIQY